MVEPVSAIAIVTTVVKVVTTSVTTAQTISDYVSRYQIAEIQIVAMRAECSTVLAALLELQNIIIQNDVLQETTSGSANQTLKYVQTDYRGILSQCFAVFALLNEKLEKLNVHQLGKRSESSAKAKIRAVWYGDSMRILRENIKGQVSAVTLLLTAFQIAASARLSDSVAANTKSIVNNTQLLDNIFQMLTQRDNAILLMRVADDARSLSSSPLAQKLIEYNDDAQSVFSFEEKDSGLERTSKHRDLHRTSNQTKDRVKRDKRKGKMPERQSLYTETDSSTAGKYVRDSDRFSFVTARSKIIPSIRSMLGSRTISNSSSHSTLYGASTRRPVSLTQIQLEMQPTIGSAHTLDSREGSGSIANENMDKLQDEQRARWEYLTQFSPHQVILDQTIDEYEETEKEFEERGELLKVQISGVKRKSGS